MASLAEYFGALRSTNARDSALRAFVRSLDVPDLRLLSEIISERNDIVSRLPIELVHHIFDKLPLLSAWRLQLVGRRWRNILSEPQFLSIRLAQHDLLQTPSKAPAVPTSAEMVRRAVRHMQAMRLGRPFSFHETRLDVSKLTERPQTHLQQLVAFHGHSLAFPRAARGGGSEVVLRDLVTGHDRVFCDEAREDILSVTLSDSTLAFVSFSSMLYIADLRSEEPPVRLRLPSLAVTGLTSDHGAVALLIGVGTILMYSPDTKRLTDHRFNLQQVDADPGSLLTPQQLLLDYRRGTIDVMSCHYQPGVTDAIHIGHMRLQRNHAPSEHGLLACSRRSIVRFVPTEKNHPVVIDQVQPMGQSGIYHVQLKVLSRSRSERLNVGHYSRVHFIMFDTDMPTLYMDEHSVPAPVVYNKLTANCHMDSGSSLLRWKDVVYAFRNCDVRIKTYVQQKPDTVTRLPSDRGELRFQSEIDGPPSIRSEQSLELYAAFVNDSCVATVAVPAELTRRQIRRNAVQPYKSGRILIWWFDEATAAGALGRSTGLWPPQKTYSDFREGEHEAAARERQARLWFNFKSSYVHQLPYEKGRRNGAAEEF